MKQRRIIAIILTIILTLATVLTVFAAFRFEVQFPSKLNTFTYDQSSASFKLNGNNSFTLNLSDPGSAGNFSAVVTGDKDVPEVKDDEDNVVTPGRAGTPLMYSYKLSLGEMNIEENKVLLSSVIVYLNGEIQGTLYSVMTDNLGMIGTTSYVLPNDSVTDDLRLELHLASDATPYDAETNDITVTVTCTATNHNAQEYSFVNSTEKLIQAISEVNRGAQNKTIVLYGGVEVTTAVPAVTNPCTFDVQSATFTAPIAVNIESDPVDGVPTDIVTVLSSKGAFDPKDQNGDAVDVNGFTITKGAIDRADNAYKVGIIVGEGANHYSIQYIIDSHLESLIAHGMHAGVALDLSFKGFGCYIESVTSSDTSVLQIVSNGKALYPADIDVSKVVTATIKMITGDTHTHTVKVIGHNDAELQSLLNDELKYISDLTVAGKDVSFSVPLPTVIKSKNATIEWHSSDPEKFSSQGVCSPSANGYVTLTAVIRINEAVYTEHFKIHIATLTNQDRLEAMIAAMGNLTLNTIWTGTHQDGKLDVVYLPTTEAVTDGQGNVTGYRQLLTGVTDPISTFDIDVLTFSINEDAYGYIGFPQIDSTDAQGNPIKVDDTTRVVLDYATFQTMALVDVTAHFTTGEPKDVPSTVSINIQLGSDTDLGEQILEYVQSQMNNVNVLQNMLDTRTTDEKGDFTLPTEYNGFDILYSIGANQPATVHKGVFTVDPTQFRTSYYSVPVDVKILIKGETDAGTNDVNVIASRTMYFDVPPVIRADEYGFMDYNAAGQTATNLLLTEIREQVNEQLPTSEQWTTADANNPYILLRDIQHANVQSLEIDLTNAPLNTTGYKASSINGLAYFTNLTKFTVKGLQSLTYVDDKGTVNTSDDTVVTEATAPQLARVAATYHGLTELTLSNIGLTDISPLLSLTKLTKLDISKNTNLQDITGLVKYDATKLKELNISGTAVNMEHARPMLTNMYYKYEAANTASTQKTPKYYYTHEYTPIADGALLLEPDAISVSGSTATVAGERLVIANLSIVNGVYTARDGGTTVQIDGEKSVTTPATTKFTIVKGANSAIYDATTGTLIVTEGIVTFNLGNESNKSSFTTIEDLLFQSPIIITNATVNPTDTLDTSGTKIVTQSDSSAITSDEFEPIPVGNGVSIPVIYGVIQTVDGDNDGDTDDIKLTPLKKADGTPYTTLFKGVTDNNGTTTIADILGNNNNVTSTLTKITITGGDLDGNTVNIGLEGGTITVEFDNDATTRFTFVVAPSTNLTISSGTQRVEENAIITITAIDSEKVFSSITGVTFSNATIKNDTTTQTVGNTNYTVYTPTIHVENEGCVMQIGNSVSIDLPAGIKIPLPTNTVGSINGTVVQVSTLATSGYANNTSWKKFQVLNAQRTSTESDPVLNVADAYGWTVSRSGLQYSGTATITSSGRGTAYLYSSDEKVWIPVSQLTLSADKTSVELNINFFRDKWGYVENDTNNTVDVSITDKPKISTANYTSISNFQIDMGDFELIEPENENDAISWVLPFHITLPTDAINPQYVGIRTAAQEDAQEMSANKVIYNGYEIYGFGCSIANGTITPADGYQWFAILLDGEYITISDFVAGTSSITYTTEEEDVDGETITKYTITVNNTTSTIGKGALVTKSTTANVTYSDFTLPSEDEIIYTISGGALVPVTVSYSKSNGIVDAVIDNIVFEPLALKTEEIAGLDYLFLLSEVPAITHVAVYTTGNTPTYLHGSYIHLASRVVYNQSGHSVKVTWEIWDDGVPGEGAAIVRNDYYTFARLETVNGLASGEYVVTLRAQVNVNGLITYRYFSFTVTYN